jgi:transposase
MAAQSGQRLSEEAHLNLAYRWFCKMDLSGPIPDHSTFFKNRQGRFCDSDVLRYVFEAVVAQCIGAGLAIGQRYAANANIIAADASRQKLTPKADWNPEAIDPDSAPRQVQEYLDTLDDAVQGNHGAR